MKFWRLGLLAACVILAGCASSGGGTSNHGSHKKKTLASHHRFSPREHEDVWARIREGYGMEQLNDPKIDYWVSYYTKNPQSVEKMAQSSSKYIYYVATELEKRGMPTELALLPFVESAYRTNAYSRTSASGLWQFMPATGTEYHLNQDWWGDDRRDPVYSTQAALEYLSFLYDLQGGDWFLALASYNWGPTNVTKARQRNESKGLGTDFLSLNMPAETRNYVPKLLALKQIVSQPSNYGITLPKIPDKSYFAEYKGKKDIDVEVAAKLAGMSLEEFKELNAGSTTRPVILASSKRLLIPQSKLDHFKKNLANYQGELATWTAYQPTTGESLDDIAARHGVSVQTLKSLNNYKSQQTVALSSRPLLVPKAAGSPAAVPQTAPVQTMPDVMLAAEPVKQSSGTRDYRNAVAAETGRPTTSKAAAVTSALPDQAPALAARPAPAPAAPVGVDPLAGLVARAEAAPAHQSVQVAAPAPAPSGRDPLAGLVAASAASPASAAAQPDAAYETRKVSYMVAGNPSVGAHSAVYQSAAPAGSGAQAARTHRVAPGETMFSLARQYGTSVQILSVLNNVTPNTLKAGMVLRLPGSGVNG